VLQANEDLQVQLDQLETQALQDQWVSEVHWDLLERPVPVDWLVNLADLVTKDNQDNQVSEDQLVRLVPLVLQANLDLLGHEDNEDNQESADHPAKPASLVRLG